MPLFDVCFMHVGGVLAGALAPCAALARVQGWLLRVPCVARCVLCGCMYFASEVLEVMD